MSQTAEPRGGGVGKCTKISHDRDLRSRQSDTNRIHCSLLSPFKPFPSILHAGILQVEALLSLTSLTPCRPDPPTKSKSPADKILHI